MNEINKDSIENSRESPTRRAIIGLVICVLLIGYLSWNLRPQSLPLSSMLSYSDFTDLKKENASPVVALLGEFRAGISYILFLKTEQYLHSGIRYRPLSEKEKQLGRQEIHHESSLPEHEEARHNSAVTDHVHDEDDPDHDHSHEHSSGHTHGAQMVPPPDWDHRGIFGKIDRAIHPYEAEGQEMEHGEVKQMLPWYRLVTYANPRFAKAYVIGAFVISRFGDREDEAEEFLREGLRMNPDSIEIKEALARHFFHRKRNPVRAKPLFQSAIAIGKEKKELSADEEHALQSAYSNLTLLEWRSNEDPAAALRVIEDGLQRIPDNRALLMLKGKIEKERTEKTSSHSM